MVKLRTLAPSYDGVVEWLGAVRLSRSRLSTLQFDLEGWRLARKRLPLRLGNGASFLVGLAIDDVAFEVKVVVGAEVA